MSYKIRVATYNIRHGEGMDGKVDLDRIAQVIVELSPDVIGLQEVDNGWKRSGEVNQARYLADALGMQYVFGTAMTRGQARFGNAVLSRLSILEWNTFPMASTKEPRTVLATKLSLEGQTIDFLTTHLGLSYQERMDHIRQILVPLLNTSLPLILTGDFNVTPDAPEIRELKLHLQDSDLPEGQYTYPSQRPAEKIDYIMHSAQITTESATVISSSASDHNPMLAVLEIPRPD